MTQSTLAEQPSAESQSGATASGNARKRVLAFFSALLVLASVVVLVYPVLATAWNNRVQDRVSQEYSRIVEDTPAEERNEILAAAREYNTHAPKAPILDPWLSRIAEDNAEYQAYLAQLSGANVMSQITYPDLGIKLPIRHGSSEDVLQIGAGHLYGSSLPVGGSDTHAVVTAHTGLTDSTMFDNLRMAEIGDHFFISTFGELMRYEVYDYQVVLPDEVDSLGVVAGEDLFTLITCTPYGINTHRILVHAKRVPLEAGDQKIVDDASQDLPWWMKVMLAAAALILILLAVWLIRTLQRSRRTKVQA